MSHMRDESGYLVVCDKAPFGWYCSRPPYHDGPCAAHAKWWMKLKLRLKGIKV